MPRFFTQSIFTTHGNITGADAIHMSRVLRVKPGERITVCDLCGHDYDCIITSVSDDVVSFDIENMYQSSSEPDISVTLYMALPKGDKFELVVQKCVELGVDRIVPMMSNRCVARPDEKAMLRKIVRYNKISYEAAKQSGRAKIPKIEGILDFASAVEQSKQSELALLFYENGGVGLNETTVDKAKKISYFIGSEGGFDESEVEFAKANSVKIVSLGTRILRCETAAIAAATAIMFRTGNL